MITKGQKRVMEKVKEIRQNFSKAVLSGSRSGSGKIVYEFYDKLITLWGGSASTEPLSYGVGEVDLVEDTEARRFFGRRGSSELGFGKCRFVTKFK